MAYAVLAQGASWSTEPIDRLILHLRPRENAIHVYPVWISWYAHAVEGLLESPKPSQCGQLRRFGYLYAIALNCSATRRIVQRERLTDGGRLDRDERIQSVFIRLIRVLSVFNY